MIKISWLYIIFLDALFLVPIVVENILPTVHLLRLTEMEPIDVLNHVKTKKKNLRKSAINLQINHLYVNDKIPRIFIPLGDLSTPPTNSNKRAFLTSSCP